MVLGTVKTFPELVIVRLLLGAFEAGLFPGIVYCLTYWYKQDERAGRLALITGGATLGETRGHPPYAADIDIRQRAHSVAPLPSASATWA